MVPSPKRRPLSIGPRLIISLFLHYIVYMSRRIPEALLANEVDIRDYFYSDYERKITKIKYPTFAISNAELLSSKIETFKEEKVQAQLKACLQPLNSFRRIRGDGNCFFRALAFSVLAMGNKVELQQCFPFLGEIKLTSCYKNSIPKQFQAFYNHSFLKHMLLKFWEPQLSKQYDKNGSNIRKALIKIYDEYPFLDFIVVLYFRAVCSRSLSEHKDSLKQFLLGNELQYINKYGEQTEGVVINLFSIMFGVIIHVYEVRKAEVKAYHYDNVKDKLGEVSLLFYQQHYDIVEYNEHIKQQEDSLTKSSFFYTDVNRKKIEGVCIECKYRTKVYEDSSICSYCYVSIENAMKRMQISSKKEEEKFSFARCNDCKQVKMDVSNIYGLCKECKQHQNTIQERREREAAKPKPIKAQCIECELEQEVQPDTGMCQSCTIKQKSAMNRMAHSQYKPAPKKQPAIDSYLSRLKARDSSVTNRKTETLATTISKEQLTSSKLQPSTKQEDKFDERTLSILKSKLGSRQETTVKTMNGQALCAKCNQRCELYGSSLICTRCRQQKFNNFGKCLKCQFKEYCNDEQICYSCFGRKKKPAQASKISRATKKACGICHEPSDLVQDTSVCKICYDKYYCSRCKSIMSPYTLRVSSSKICEKCLMKRHLK